MSRSSGYRSALVAGAGTLLVPLFLLIANVVQAQTPEEQIEKLQEQLNALKAITTAIDPEEEERRYTSKITQISPARVVQPPRQEELIVTRLYDLSDLFAIVPAYPAQFESDLSGGLQMVFPPGSSGDGTGAVGGGGMGGGGGMFNVMDQPATLQAPRNQTLWQFGGGGGGTLDGAKTSVGNLIRAIQTTVAPDDWETAGGSFTIAQLGMALLINADESSHQQITALLGQFRKRWGTLRTVSVQAYWLWLSDDDLRSLLESEAEDQKKTGKPFAYGSVHREKWNAALRQAEDRNDDQGGYRAAVTCYNGQTVNTVAGTQQLVVTDLQPQWLGPEEVHKDQQALGAIVYSPQTRLVHEGVALQVTPLTNTSGKYVVLDLQSRLAKLQSNKQPKAIGPAVKSKAKQPAEDAERTDEKQIEAEQAVTNDDSEDALATTAIDHKPTFTNMPGPREIMSALPLPSMEVARLSTTLRVPVGEPYLVGGMSQSSRARSGDPQLYLFVELHVQELRDDLEPSVPVQTTGQTPEEE